MAKEIAGRADALGRASWSRRSVLGAAAATRVAAAVPSHAAAAADQAASPPANPLANGRPAPGQRRFTSRAVEATITQLRNRLGRSEAGRKLAEMFARCYPNTLDTTVEEGSFNGKPDTFVITGDIPAMWLRDSAAQVAPYLRHVRQDPALARLLAGVIGRQARCVLADPYANAFTKSDSGADRPGVHERKWELDSLCYVIRLAHAYWKSTGDAAPIDEHWFDAARVIVETMRVEQRKDGVGPYRFVRRTAWPHDTAYYQSGAPVRPVGMIASVFRPSDDGTIFPFLIPSNMMAVVSLRQLAELHDAISRDARATAECRALADEVDAAIRTYGIVDHPRRGRVFAFEVDGYGGQVLMDDANAPSLLSIPYFGWCAAHDPVYRATRAMVLSPDNPWFSRGAVAEGIGSIHTSPGSIWPMSLIMRALTSDDADEIVTALRQLMACDAGTGFMHESFDKDDPAKFSRPWFAWANGLFGELVLKVLDTRPELFARL